MVIKLYRFAFSLILSFVTGTAISQKSPTDSLIALLSQSMPDTSRVLLLDQIGRAMMYSKPLTAMQYSKEGLAIAQKVAYQKGTARSMNRLGSILRITGNYASALEMHFGSLKVAEANQDLENSARALNNIGVLYSEQKESKTAISYYQKAKAIAEQLQDRELIQNSLINLGTDYALLNQLDSARICTQRAYEMALKRKSSNVNVLLMNLGNIHYRLGSYPLSLEYYRSSLPYSKAVEDNRILSQTYFEMAQVFKRTNRLDSCLRYAQWALEVSQAANNVKYIYESSFLLSTLFDKTSSAKSYQYFKLAAAAKDSLFNQEKVKQVQNLSFNEQLRRQALIDAEAAFQTKLKIGGLLGALAVFLLLAAILYRNNRQKNKANARLREQKQAIETQQAQLKASYETLKTTQNQLIQSEKLASLGELAAGIAHEIQNPLNFVNNFSEVSVELMEELKEERAKMANLGQGIRNDELSESKELEEELLGDIEQNLVKIAQHGKRAASIVKNMLEHSRTSTGERTLTDLNALADEYLRLSFHGMKAKIKNFNSDYELITDKSLSPIKVVPQDIGRVLLNIINNAFYAVAERAKQNEISYQPKVTIHTNYSATEGYGIIRIQDNGNGMSEAVKAKIFQPFFTTKPTGEGTGLGLSLSYDIITKGHGGTIEVESEEGKGATFVVRLPMKV